MKFIDHHNMGLHSYINWFLNKCIQVISAVLKSDIISWFFGPNYIVNYPHEIAQEGWANLLTFLTLRIGKLCNMMHFMQIFKNYCKCQDRAIVKYVSNIFRRNLKMCLVLYNVNIKVSNYLYNVALKYISLALS